MIQRPRCSWLDAEPIPKLATSVDGPAAASGLNYRPASALAECRPEPGGSSLTASGRSVVPAGAPKVEQQAADDIGSDGSLGQGYTGALVAAEPSQRAEPATDLLPAGAEGNASALADPTPDLSPALAEESLALQATTVAGNAKEFDAMADGRFVSYLRVSTARQGASGLGLEAQRKAVADFLAGGRWTLMREVVEVESGKRTDRPKLAEAMALCRIHGATLVIAKIDRLSRNAAFLLNLRDAGVDFVAADMPNANRLTVGIMAMVAEAERDAISARTKAALAAKARWYEQASPEQLAELREQGRATHLGGARLNSSDIHRQGGPASLAARQAKAARRVADLAPVIADLRAEGVTSLAGLATALTSRGIPTSRGAERWSASQVSRLTRGTTNGS